MTTLLPFHWHLVELLCVGAIVVTHHRAVKLRRERQRARWALAALAVVVVWPIGDLAASVSISVATAQRLVIMLLVAPLLFRSLPTVTLATMTRPAPIDFLVRRSASPGVAILLVTVIGTLTLTPGVVDWGARSAFGRDVTLLAVLAVGLVLWVPALALMPGTRHLSPMARAAYIFVSSLVVTSLSFVWIFSRHPMYSALHDQHALLGMTPLFDQQLAGFVAKFLAYIPMWAVSFTVFSRAEERGVPLEETPLHWADVEREMLRVDRRRTRDQRHRRPAQPLEG